MARKIRETPTRARNHFFSYNFKLLVLLFKYFSKESEILKQVFVYLSMVLDSRELYK